MVVRSSIRLVLERPAGFLLRREGPEEETTMGSSSIEPYGERTGKNHPYAAEAALPRFGQQS